MLQAPVLAPYNTNEVAEAFWPELFAHIGGAVQDYRAGQSTVANNAEAQPSADPDTERRASTQSGTTTPE
jgi:hypothetical protein